MSRGERRVPWPGHQKLHRGVEVTGPNPVHCIFQHEVAENETKQQGHQNLRPGCPLSFLEEKNENAQQNPEDSLIPSTGTTGHHRIPKTIVTVGRDPVQNSKLRHRQRIHATALLPV